MNNIYLARLFKSSEFRLSIVSLFALGIGFLVNWLLTKYLPPVSFGAVRVLTTVWQLSFIVVNMGLFYTVANIVLGQKDIDFSELLAYRNLGNLISVVVGIGLWLVFVLYILISDYFFGTGFGFSVFDFLICFFGLGFSLFYFLQEYSRATKKFNWMLVFQLFQPLVYLTFVCLILYFNLNDHRLIFESFLLSYSLIACVYFYYYRLSRPDLNLLRQVFSRNRSIGFKIYQASILGSTSSQIGLMLLSVFGDLSVVALFALSITLYSPLLVYSNSVGNLRFKDFVGVDIFCAVFFKKFIVASTVLALFYFFVVYSVFDVFFGETYIPVKNASVAVAVGFLFRGIGDVLNRYLMSNSKTVYIRNNGIHSFVLTMVFYSLLGYFFGFLGAVFAKLLIDFFYFSSMLFYSKNLQRELSVIVRE